MVIYYQCISMRKVVPRIGESRILRGVDLRELPRDTWDIPIPRDGRIMATSLQTLPKGV